MSPRKFATPPSDVVAAGVRRFWATPATRLRDRRLARRWTVAHLAQRAGVSSDTVYLAESGVATSPEALARLASALGLRLEVELVDATQRQGAIHRRLVDPVHSAMGEFATAHLRRQGYQLGLDEPYQHFQYAGRADVVAWDAARRALLHIENRTRFPDIQDMAGTYNAKRAYLGPSIGERLGIRRWASETHVLMALWSAEALHVLRLRRESFRALCPDGLNCFAGWWSGRPPATGRTSVLVVLDPLAKGRQRAFVGLGEAVQPARDTAATPTQPRS